VLPLTAETALVALQSASKVLPWLDERAVELDVAVQPSLHYLGFGMKDDTVGPNVKLRRAVSLAVSAEDVIKLHHGGLAIPAEGPFPPGVSGYDAELRNPWRRADLDAAAKMLAEAGYPGGKDAAGNQLELRIDAVGNTRHARATAEYLAGQLAKLGVKLHIVVTTDEVYVRKRRTGFLQIFEERADLTHASTNDVLAHFFGPAKAPGPNIAHYDRRAFNDLHVAALGMAPGPAFDEVVRKQTAMVIDDAVWIPLAHPVRTRLRHCWMQNVKPHALAPSRMKHWRIDTRLRETMRTLWKHDAPPKPTP
jgi:oligopeptide transport system substrate-binding protein